MFLLMTQDRDYVYLSAGCTLIILISLYLGSIKKQKSYPTYKPKLILFIYFSIKTYAYKHTSCSTSFLEYFREMASTLRERLTLKLLHHITSLTVLLECPLAESNVAPLLVTEQPVIVQVYYLLCWTVSFIWRCLPHNFNHFGITFTEQRE